jgi:hypothetical protein
MTSASQAGILHGADDGIPAFRRHERDASTSVAVGGTGLPNASRSDWL